jgi:hypothetical protein
MSKPKFPPICCVACKYSHTDSDNDLICYVDPPWIVPDGLGGSVAQRGALVERDDVPCDRFIHKEHA